MTAPAKERGGGEPARVGPDDTVTVWFCANCEPSGPVRPMPKEETPDA